MLHAFAKRRTVSDRKLQEVMRSRSSLERWLVLGMGLMSCVCIGLMALQLRSGECDRAGDARPFRDPFFEHAGSGVGSSSRASGDLLKMRLFTRATIGCPFCERGGGEFKKRLSEILFLRPEPRGYTRNTHDAIN